MKKIKALSLGSALIIALSVTALGSGRNDVHANTNSETLSVNQIAPAMGIWSFLQSLFGAAASAPEQTTHNSTGTGQQVVVAPGVHNPLSFSLQLSGDLPGTLSGTIEFDASNNITGGTWHRNVTNINPDGSTFEVGTISGQFTSGSVTLTPNGTPSSVSNVQLSISGGIGIYANVSTGSGTFQGSFDDSTSPATLTVSETLTF